MRKQYLTTLMRDTDPDYSNIRDFVKILSSTGIIKLIKILDGRTLSYSDWLDCFGVESKTGLFSYYLRKMKKFGIITSDRSHNYSLTFKGTKIAELIDALTKIANLNMSDPSNASTTLSIKLAQSRSWLEPLIKSEIQSALEKIISNKEIKN